MLAAAATLAVSLAADRAMAAERMDDPKAGHQFAEQNCARCHAIGRTGASPFKDAPPFRLFAQRWPLEDVEEALAEGIVTGHKDMPEFELTPEQIGDLIAYLRTLGPSKN